MSAQKTAEQSTQQTTSQGGQRGQQLARRGGAGLVPSLFEPFDVFANPFSMIRRVQDEINRVFSLAGAAPSRGEDITSVIWTPPIEIAVRDNTLEVSAELPGLSEKDVRVEIDNDTLVIQGERKVEEQREEGGVRRSERRYGRFYRAIALPDGVDPQQARAEFRDGILRVTVPIPQAQTNVRQVPIQTGQGQQQPSKEKAA